METFLIKKDSPYLTYITSLNYWDTNWFFVVLIFCLLTKLSDRFFIWNFLILLLNYFKFPLFRQLFFKKTILISLFAGTITIHPLLFYLSTVSFFVMVIYKIQSDSLTINFTTTYCLSRLLFLALILGGFWGLQSLSWGYVWVNDLVEWSLFLILSLSLTIIHKFDKKSIFFFSTLFMFLILNITLAIRLNLFSTRHSFLTSINYMYITYSFYFFFMIFFNILYVKGVVTNTRLRFATVLCVIMLSVFKKFSITFLFKFGFFYAFSILFLQNLLRKLYLYRYLHFFLFSFVLVWVIFFSFFHLNYAHLEHSRFIEVAVIFKSLLVGVDFYTFFNKFSLIEFINFYEKLPTLTDSGVLWQLLHQIVFNNFSIFIFVGLIIFL